MGAIAVTGAAGFLGRRLLNALTARGETIVAIARRPRPENLPSNITWVEADLAERACYEAALKDVDVLIHAAALTGKAPRDEYRRANVDIVETVLAASAAAGLKRFIFVSSIAAAYTNLRHYHYGHSKIDAEALVRSSPMEWTILRPTMIFGEGSPLLESLGKLAGLPARVAFGSGKTLVHPVHVDDVADILALLARAPEAASQIIGFGGADIITMDELLARLRATQGKAPAGAVHLPLAPIREVLALAEGSLLSLLPFTAGQMALFANDGAAPDHALSARLLPQRRAPF